MAAKPTPGGSDGTYGNELNEFLDVSLASDGKIKDGAVFSSSATPTVDAGLANKKYVDDKTNLRARMFRNSDQSIPTGTDTIIAFSTDTYDDDNITTTGASAKITPAVEGYYLVIAQTEIKLLSDIKAATIKLLKNTTSIVEFSVASAGTQNYSTRVSDVMFLDADDFVQVKINHNNGSNLNISGRSQDTFITLQRIGT